MNNVHPIFRAALTAFAPKPTPDQLLAEQLQPYEVDVSPSHHAEPIFVIADVDTVKEAAAELIANHPRELSDIIVRKLQEQNRRVR